MPAPAPNTDLTSTSGLSGLVAQQQKDIGKLSKDVAASTAEEKATEDSAYKGFTSDLSSIADQFEKLKKEGEDVLKPFTPPKPEDPLKSYGATIGGLMGIVSFFTHQPMIGSLNAAAAAVNAARAGNDDAYNKSFEQWKANTDLAAKRLNWENDQLKTILDLSKTNYDAATSHVKSLAAITNDKALVVSLEANGIEGVSKLLDARIKGQEEADRHSQFLLDFGQQQSLVGAMNALNKPPKQGAASGLPNAGREVDLYSVSGVPGDISGVGAVVEGLTTGKTAGMASRHVQTKEALEQLREKTLDTFRSSQVGRSLASQMKAVDDIVPKGGFVTYPSLREAVLQTRENLASLLTNLADDAQDAYALKNRAKLTEDLISINKVRSLMADYDNILQNNPDPNAPTDKKWEGYSAKSLP